jgi:hypothetical protein
MGTVIAHLAWQLHLLIRPLYEPLAYFVIYLLVTQGTQTETSFKKVTDHSFLFLLFHLAGARYNPDVGVFVSLTGCLLSMPCFTVFVKLNKNSQRLPNPYIMHILNAFAILQWAPMAVYYQRYKDKRKTKCEKETESAFVV